MAFKERPDPVRQAIDLMRLHEPAIYPSAVTMLAERVSDMVVARKWIIGDGGVLLTTDNPPLTVEDWINQALIEGPHNLIPPEVTDAGDDTWTAGTTLEKQAIRWRQLRAVLGNDKAANAALAKEAATYGAAVGSLKPGVKPGEVGGKVETDDAATNSPFDTRRHFESPETRANECRKWIIRFGPQSAARQSALHGTDLAGRKLVPWNER
jgi:hypothetical protein